MEIKLSIKRLDRLPMPKYGKDILAIYNVVFDGETLSNKEPMIKGVRLFLSDKSSGRKYIRLPQQRLKTGNYLDQITFPAFEFQQLEKLIIADFENSPDNTEINLEEIEEMFSEA